MKRRLHSSFLKLSLSIGLLAGLYSCEKYSSLGEDNNKVVRTPYGLYMGAEDGSIIHSNNGIDFNIKFPTDGYPISHIMASGENLFIIKAKLHKSNNEGKSFNATFEDYELYPWESMMLSSIHQDRIYIAGKFGRGIIYSDDAGETWQEEEEDYLPENLPPSYKISSYAELGNGTIFAYSNKSNLLLKKVNNDEAWEPVTSEGFFPVTGTNYYLTSNATHIFLVDYNGRGGAWYSEDEGNFWTRIEQGELPTRIKYNAAVSGGYGSTLVIGTDKGSYFNDNGRFVEAFGGLEKETEVYTLTHKRNTFKNDNVKDYIYMGTNTGIYRSEDLGRTWDLLTKGALQKSYKSSF